MTKEEKIISVSRLTGELKIELEGKFSNLKIEGEISNWKAHSSGHKYFTLKDDGAAISCVMWRYRKHLNFIPEDGMKVIVKGNITVYPPQGRYQIDIEEMSPAGQGDLFLAFEALKKKLDAKGYFANERKRPIPRFPQRIGVATSPTGAAVKDIFSTLERRYPAAEIYFRPTLVQGPGAAEDIVKAINELNQTEAEILIIGRGGGSLEDLWCFNEEITADAIVQSQTPVISAVGHETDFTIADFVSDLRAATPTAAAEIASPITIDRLQDFVESNTIDMTKEINNNITKYSELLDSIFTEIQTRRIREKLNSHYQNLDDMQLRIKRNVGNGVDNLLEKNIMLTTLIRSLNPMAPLEKGYAILKSRGKIIDAKKSLLKYKSIEIVRERETAVAEIRGLKTEELF